MATLAELQEDLADLKQARKAVLIGGQEYEAPGGRSTKRANLETLNSEIRRLEVRIAVASQGGVLSHSQAVFGGRR